jgi:lipopolysaccharide export system protein LptA
MRALSLAVLLLAFTGATSAWAQAGTCEVNQRPGARDAVVVNAGQPTQVAIVYLADIRCSNGRHILADQATTSEASGIIELYGNVQVTDPERTLRAGQATFFTRQRQLRAQIDVVVTERESGSIIRSDLLNYYEQSAQRPQSLMVASRIAGPRARAVLFSDRGAQAPRDSTVIDAHEIQITGDDMLRGTGDAVLTRDSLRATAYQIEYYRQTGSLEIAGGGVVTLPSYELRGDSITATVGDDNEIEAVLTRHGSSLQAEEMQVTAPAIRLFFENGGISRMVAMNWRPQANAQAGPRPVAVSEQFRMEADSLDVLAPNQQITEATAIGQAYVERITPDSLHQYLPEAAENVMALIRNDWMRGDTVRAFFAAATDTTGDPDAPAEPTGASAPSSERLMERLTAEGGPAQAMHRMRPENAASDARLSIAYLIGSRVEVTFADGVVTEVMASEDVSGVYLQPSEAVRRAAAANARRSP